MAKRTLIKKSAPVDHIDGYSPPDAASMLHRDVLDGYENLVTGVGDWTRDKTYGGNQSGPAFRVRFLSGSECEDRYRGSDLGGRVVETLPDEMTREWIDIQIQPDDTAERGASPEKKALELARVRGDAFPGQPGGPPVAPAEAHQPGMLPDVDDESARVVEAIEREQRALGAKHVFREALNFERAYGGGAVFLGVDDGEKDLTRPLDLDKVRRIKHLTAYRGGWDGELVAWRYYNDPREPKFGEPEIYQLRNLGVPIAMPPAPGETSYVPQMPPAGPTGALVFYVHESRLLLFPGTAVSRRARVQMRGWGDSIFTRVDEVLSQYGQTWGGIAILMQEWSQGVLSIEGLATTLASKDPKAQARIVERAQLLQVTQSIARMRLIDAREKYSREVTPMSGVAEVLNQFMMRLAAAANMPVSLLFGQVKGGLGDSGNTDLRFFYDRVKSMQDDRLVPPASKLVQIQLRSKQGPTGGTEPKRWRVEPRALYQLNEQEKAELRNKQMQTDVGYIGVGAVSPEEIAASRFGGSDYSTDTVLDLEGRQKMGAVRAAPAPGGGQPPPNPTKNPGPGEPPTGQLPAPRPGGSPPQVNSATGGPQAPASRQPGPEGPARADAEWSEELHPRDPAGKFGEGGGGVAGGEKKTPGERFTESRTAYHKGQEERRRAVSEKHGVDPNNIHQHEKAWREYKRGERPHEEKQREIEREITKGARSEKNASEHRQKAEKAAAESRAFAAAHPGPAIPKEATPEQIKEAKAFIAPHAEHLADNLEELYSVATPDAVISGRAKEVGSALEKTVRKPENYPDVNKLQDATGMRVIAKDIASVKANVAAIKANYKVISEENAIDNPKGDYRSYHMTVETKTGQVAEVQIRTPGQHEFAEWAHNVYKPVTAEQKESLKSGDVKREVNSYSKAVADHIYDKDMGRDAGPAPEPSPRVREIFGAVKL